MFNFDASSIETWFLVIEMICLVLAVVFILMQNRGAGLSGSFGGSDEIYLTRRGIEKSVVQLTVACITVFVFLRFLSFYLPQEEGQQSTPSTPDSSEIDINQLLQEQQPTIESVEPGELENQEVQTETVPIENPSDQGRESSEGSQPNSEE
jgi:preprotein translocase subunit SecG